ncbi:MAG: hypothetical protein S4CHLAM20_00220 [Chlamydiia bacterium]|nr:hypothetical protein [Chlamydiia bacterium]
MIESIVILSLMGLIFGAGYLLKEKQKEVKTLKLHLEDAQSKLSGNEVEKAKLETMLQEQTKSFEERLKLVDESKDKLKDLFKMISTEAMEKMEEKAGKEELRRERVLSDLVKPMKESLNKLDDKMGLFEKERKGDKEAFSQQMRQMLESEKDLLKETKNLKDALSKPEIRGLWGEMQLKRVIEISGMLNYCDFIEQSVEEGENGRIRPDMIIKLAGDRTIIVDAKSPFEGFLKAMSTDNVEEKQKQLERHARHLRNHIQMLSKKKYYEGFTQTPEFVVLFLPSEVFFSAAMQVDPTLLEYGAKLGVILATPSTLLGLLRSVAYGWKSESMTENAKAIQTLGKELYKRILDMSRHLSGMGKSLNSAIDGYNKTIGSYERRVLPSARKFGELSASSDDEISVFEPIDNQVRNIQHIELEKKEDIILE